MIMLNNFNIVSLEIKNFKTTTRDIMHFNKYDYQAISQICHVLCFPVFRNSHLISSLLHSIHNKCKENKVTSSSKLYISATPPDHTITRNRASSSQSRRRRPSPSRSGVVAAAACRHCPASGPVDCPSLGRTRKPAGGSSTTFRAAWVCWAGWPFAAGLLLAGRCAWRRNR